MECIAFGENFFFHFYCFRVTFKQIQSGIYTIERHVTNENPMAKVL